MAGDSIILGCGWGGLLLLGSTEVPFGAEGASEVRRAGDKPRLWKEAAPAWEQNFPALPASSLSVPRLSPAVEVTAAQPTP